MRVVLFGPPGAGKGTQAKKIAAAYGLHHLSTGEMFRVAIRHDNEVGRTAKQYIEKGKLVPDDLVCAVADEALSAIGANSFVLDGFPRTLPQADWLDTFLGSEKNDIHVVSLQVDDSIIVNRLSQRRSHRVTGAIYHLTLNPPPPDVLPEDLELRLDDIPEAIQKRLTIYHNQTFPLEEFYRKSGRLVDIDGIGSVEEIFDRISATLMLSTSAH